MQTTKPRILTLAAFAFQTLAATLAVGQVPISPAPASPAGTASAASDQPIELSPFSVSAQTVGRYSSAEASSSTRVATNLFTSTQSIAVVTREAFEDTGAMRILDVARYVAGISESTVPTGLDRVTIRGFQTEGQTVDGFYSGAQANIDPVFIDRLEIVKGPNAILAPNGIPGGTINEVTRKPVFNDAASVGAAYGRYDGVRGEFDVNRTLSAPGSNRLAVRVVGEASDNRDAWRGDVGHSAGAMPELLLQTKTGAQVLLQLQAFTWRVQGDTGLPIDPSSGTATDAHLISGVSRTLNINDDDYRFERRLEGRFLLTAPLNEQLSTRVALRYTHLFRSFATFTLSNLTNETANAAGVVSGNSGGGYNPKTGEYVPGSAFYVDPTTGAITTYAATPAPRIYTRGAQYAPETHEYFDFQNDYAYKLNFDPVNLTTVAGVADIYIKQHDLNYGGVGGGKPPINFDAPAPATAIVGALNQSASAVSQAEQAYVTENAALLGGKVNFNGGLTYYNVDLHNHDPFQSMPSATAAADTVLKAYGISVSPIKWVSAYYSYNDNASGNIISAPSNVQKMANPANPSPVLQTGRQHEYGVRFQSPDQQYYVTVAHFDIRQNNYSVPNPGNYAYPQPNPPLPSLFTDRHAKGWEVEARASLTSKLSLMGNWTHFTNRDAHNVPFRGTAETSAGLLANYDLSGVAPLKGLSVGLGIDYRGRAPGDAAPSGYTSAPYVVTYQPSFYLPARTLVNLMASYRVNANLRIQAIVANLLNKEYLQSSINRYQVYPGMGIDPQVRVTYKF